MCKAMTLPLLLLICAVWLQAEPEPASPASEKDQKLASLTTIQGCLQVTNGQYIFTEADGTAHLLSGAAKQLGRQVGHEIELTGKPGVRTSDTTSVGGGSSVVEQVVFEVKTVKELAATCKTAAH